MPKKAKRLTTPQIYLILREMIMNFDLFPGARVTETQLAEQFKVSRTPIREALQRLEVEGLVKIRAKQGCFIRPIDTDTISNYYDVRVAIESMAVELACTNMPREELLALCESWKPSNCTFDLDYPEKIQQVEESFHVAIAEGSGNPVLADFLNDVNDNIRVVRRLGFPDEKSIIETYQEHYEICQLMLAKKTKQARIAIEKHIRKSQGIARSVTLSQLEQHKKQSRKTGQRRYRSSEKVI